MRELRPTPDLFENLLDLFSIDVEAEIRKLSKGSYKAAGEPASELVRFIASLFPNRIDVAVNRRHLVISCRGASPEETLIEQVASIFDPTLNNDERHDALVSLEKSHGIGILAAFAGRPSRIALQWTTSNGPKGIGFTPGEPPNPFVPHRPQDFKIAIRGRRRPKKELQTIERRCRYSSIPVWVNGKEISRGLNIDGCLQKRAIETGSMQAVVGLPMEGDLLRITRLKSGIIDEEIVRPAHQGIILSAVTAERDTSFDDTLRTLRSVGKQLLSKLATVYEDLHEETKPRALDMIFDRFQHTHDDKLLGDLPAFIQVGGPPMSLRELRKAAKLGPVHAIDGDAQAETYETSGRLVLRLDRRQRRFLDLDPTITIVSPPLRACSYTLKSNFKARIRRVTKRLKDLFGRSPGKPIRIDSLDPKERAFVAAVCAEISSSKFILPNEDRQSDVEISMAENQWRPWVCKERSGKSNLYLIARDHRLVKAMISAFSLNPSYIYPALTLLTDGHDGHQRAS